MEGLLVYKASAGSGKTFTLAVEYIKMLVRNPSAYRQILAVTFTNKATAEMKERILGQLYGIWKEDPQSNPYLEKVTEELQMSPTEIRKQAGKALGLMTHDYGRFRIETIDSFFQSVMRNLARELNLSPNLEITLDDSEVLSDAVDTLIDNLTVKSPLLVWIMQFIEERIADDKHWNVSNEIKSFGRNIFNEIYIERGKELRKKLQDPQYIASYRKKIRDLQEEYEDQLMGFPEQFDSLLSEHHLQSTDLKGGSRGISNYFNKLRNKIFSDDIRNVTVGKCLINPEEWSTKTSSRRADIIELAQEELIPLLTTAEEFREKLGYKINSCILSLQQIFKVGLLGSIDEEMRRQNHEHNRFLLADTSALLHDLMQDSDATFVFEKIGSNLHNVMIDEFQDTSRLQWDNFKLLLLECLSQGEESLLVGDVKQSIYRWRNGDWTILNGLNDHIDYFPLQVKSLKVNRRSETNIITFNNKFFTAAAQWYNNLYRQTHDTDCESLLHAYRDVEQASPHPDAPAQGYVSVTFIAKDEDKDYDTLTLEALATQIKNLIDQGLTQHDLTILIRKNKSIPIIADYFEKNYPEYRIISDEAFQLGASLSIRLIIDALRYLADKRNTIALAQLAFNYQIHVLSQKNLTLNTILLGKIIDYLPAEFNQQIDTLNLMSIYELTERLFVLFRLDHLEGQDAYLFSFFDAVEDYAADHSSDITLFLDFWDRKLCTKTIPVGEVDGIRIMSIHKAKGLQFHTVLIPYCDWSLENETNSQLVWSQPREEPFDEMNIVPMNYSTRMAQSVYKTDYQNEQLQLWVDSLNMLYVAFTRAAKNLIIWCKAGARGSVPILLEECLQTIDLTFGPSQEGPYSYSFGTLYHEKLIANKLEIFENRLEVIPEKLPVKIEIFEQKNIAFRQSNRSANFIEGSEDDQQQQYINRGKVMHAIFAEIATTADIDNTIKRFISDGVIRDEEEPEIRRLIEHALNHPLVQTWYDGSGILFNECNILSLNDQGKVETRRPDRVMKQGETMTVVDFKFGRPHPEYEEQVRGYMKLLGRMGYSQVEGYLWYVYNNKVEKVQ